jgi:hypothetical protein
VTTTDKPVRRETRSLYRAVPLVIELRSTWLVIRQKGHRQRYTVTYDQLWTIGAQNEAARVHRERAEKAKARKDARRTAKP